jgi:hypothetical protein
MITLRKAVDGSTVEADEHDTDRIERLVALGYRVVGQPPAVAKAPPKKRTTKK